MRSIGIMQGRLTEPRGRGIQFFPFEEWKNEFRTAADLGIDEIEWIFDYPDYQSNPLWTKEGRREICVMVRDTGVKVNNICLDYFMRRPFYKYAAGDSDRLFHENQEVVKRILEAMQEVGAGLLEVPMVDGSSVKKQDEGAAASVFIRWMCDEALEYGVKIGLETDFPPGDFRRFLDSIQRKNAVANYDTGNSSGLGYRHREELKSLGDYVCNVHIKDRVKGNGTVPLGMGSADFDEVFDTLKDIGYENAFILQAARGKDGNEKSVISQQIKFVRAYIKQYFNE